MREAEDHGSSFYKLFDCIYVQSDIITNESSGAGTRAALFLIQSIHQAMIKFSHCASIILILHLTAPFAFCDDPNLISQLQKLPSVHSVTSTPTKSKPKQIIIHLLNWHFVSKEDFAADLLDSSDSILSESEIDNRYLEFLDDVEAIQKEQRQILRYL
ncbi:MAG: hypothetical protein KDA74_08815, partial [Planctomycetaceae bacterium]|nr:hypothetical protein [Planctomycetaceae bacterium]